MGGGGVDFFIENPRRGGVFQGRDRGVGIVSAANCGIWGAGGGGLFFFFGAETSTKKVRRGVSEEELVGGCMGVTGLGVCLQGGGWG